MLLAIAVIGGGLGPVLLVQFKALTAGAGNLALAYVAGRRSPSLVRVAVALGV